MSERRVRRMSSSPMFAYEHGEVEREKERKRTNGGGEPRCEVHLEVAFKVQKDGNQDEELLDTNEDAPLLQVQRSAMHGAEPKRKEGAPVASQAATPSKSLQRATAS